MINKESRQVILGSAIVLLFSIPSFAALQVSNMQLDIFGGQVFSSPGTVFDKEFSFSQDSTSEQNKIIAEFQVAGDPSYWYEVRGGTINFSPSQLLADYSDGGMAVGYFDKGGILTVTGSIWYVGGETPQQVLGYGTVLQAAINAEFYAFEDMDNSILAQLNMDITGGELAAGSGSGFVLYHGIIGDTTLYDCKQGPPPGSDLTDFTQNISSSGLNSVVQIYPVPEPTIITLLGLGALQLLRRRE
jgi:hypothetical protein